MTYRQPEGITSQALRHGLLGVATSGVGSAYVNGLDGVIHQDPTDVTGLAGAQIDGGSTFHHGPAAGGDMLERPAAGYMAESSAHSGVTLDQDVSGISTIARDVNEAGTFTYDGQSYEVLDYIPGGDLVQIAAGSANPTQIMTTLAQHGIAQQMRGGDPSAGDRHAPAGPDPVGGSSTTMEAGGSSTPNDAAGSQRGDASRSIADPVHGQHVPDADENARDREALMLQHRMDLDTAVETSDQSRVVTEVHAHGRTLSIDTEFEARAPDNAEERAEAEEHVHEAARSATDETENATADMRFRSKVQAHLDAASRDEGMSI